MGTSKMMGVPMNTPNTSDKMVVGSRVAAAMSIDVEEVGDASIISDEGKE
eukprot:CAMPEP_0197185790 /NCGR_PEP_ID=MMETSP1423-20130617/12689_1 /TAXON_ID=476441 /ORGANISM="Pseudo-nitzschia heimii, Strain UNC1101" /LENGTH=49 /DNA_ID=CAMNT_0042636943 /DNA_START=337 /DNA_END=486 /DNA_ORIENTATION=-